MIVAMETSFRVKGKGGVFLCVRASVSCRKDINQNSEECIGLSHVQEEVKLSAKKKWKKDSKAILVL